jgi:nucleotide-binding universal stress UspA family protein
MADVQELQAVTPTANLRTYKSILVHAEAGLQSSRRVEIAARLARSLDARLIGLGAETFEPLPPIDPYMGYASSEWFSIMEKQVAADLENAEAGFRRDAAYAEFEWRTIQDYPAKALARTARAADLVVAGPRGEGGAGRCADPAEIIMTAGRPVLLVPSSSSYLRASTVVVAWKDTREARRAVADAMPFLQRADTVIVQGICENGSSDGEIMQTEDVASHLKRHGVRALAQVSTGKQKNVAGELQRIAEANGADLIVAGAYGHSRLREWAFGGVTDTLIHCPPCFVLFSH